MGLPRQTRLRGRPKNHGANCGNIRHSIVPVLLSAWPVARGCGGSWPGVRVPNLPTFESVRWGQFPCVGVHDRPAETCRPFSQPSYRLCPIRAPRSERAHIGGSKQWRCGRCSARGFERSLCSAKHGRSRSSRATQWARSIALYRFSTRTRRLSWGGTYALLARPSKTGSAIGEGFAHETMACTPWLATKETTLTCFMKNKMKHHDAPISQLDEVLKAHFIGAAIEKPPPEYRPRCRAAALGPLGLLKMQQSRPQAAAFPGALLENFQAVA